MKALFAPILNLFEKGDGPYQYKSSYRTVLIAVGCLFSILAAGLIAVVIQTAELAALLPLAIFLSAAAVCLVVGFLGSDRAVARVWGKA